MKKKGIFEVKTHLSELLHDVQKGEEVLITKRGEPIALLVCYDKGRPNTLSLIDDFRQCREKITWGKGITKHAKKSSLLKETSL